MELHIQKKYSPEMENLKYIRVKGEDIKEVILKNKVEEEMKGTRRLKGRLEKG